MASHRCRDLVVRDPPSGPRLGVDVEDDCLDAEPAIVLGHLVRRHVQPCRPEVRLGGLGSVGEKAASAIADFVVLDMFAAVCTGREDPKGAIKIADRQLRRIYR